MIPRYIECIKESSWMYDKTRIGDKFDTSIPNKFSTWLWDEIWRTESILFKEISAEEFHERRMIPRYVKCIKFWGASNTGIDSVIGKIYDTNIKPNFSVHTWENILEYQKCDPHFIKFEEKPNEIVENYKLY